MGEKIKTIDEMSDLERGGIISKILWAMSIIRLEQEVRYNRQKLEAHFDEEIKRFPGHKDLPERKARCLEQFDKANMDTMSNVEKAREFFAKYPEFSGLLLPSRTNSLKTYWDSFDCQVQCEEVYDENGMTHMSRPSDDECEPFN